MGTAGFEPATSRVWSDYPTTKFAALETVPIGAVVLVTVMRPVVAVDGTVAFIFVADTNVTALAAIPWNFTVEPLVNPIPLIVTTVPEGPLLGLTAVIDSVGVKLAELVAVATAVVTEILPAVAPFGTVAVILIPDATVNTAAVFPNFTMLAPLRLVPLIVTVLPVMPDAGVNELIVGATCGVTL